MELATKGPREGCAGFGKSVLIERTRSTDLLLAISVPPERGRETASRAASSRAVAVPCSARPGPSSWLGGPGHFRDAHALKLAHQHLGKRQPGRVVDDDLAGAGAWGEEGDAVAVAVDQPSEREAAA